MELHLLHTNDIHSNLENHMRIGHQIRSLRQSLKAQGHAVLTFDIGDVLDRVRPETEATMGQVNAALIAALGCDAWVFGNNEGLTIPQRLWRDLVERARSVVFGTNIRSVEGHPLPYFHEWKIYDIHDVKVGVFGLTVPYDKPYEHLDVDVMSPVECAKRTVATLRDQGCRVVIALSHLGLWDDRPLARDVSGIDLILGGHSHNFMTEPEVVNHTSIYQAGRHGMAFGHTILFIDETSQTLSGVESQLVPVEPHSPLDAEMLSAYHGYCTEVNQCLTHEVTRTETPLPVSLTHESLFPNLLADALMDAHPADIAMIMAGALNASLLPGGVTLQALHGACPTPTRPLLMTLSGADITAIIDQSLQPDIYGATGRGYGFRGSIVGYMALSNAYVEVQRDASGRFHVDSLCIGGEPVDPARKYRVVTCEFLWLSPLFKEFRQGEQIDIRPRLVREVFIEQLAKPGWIAREREPRYHVIANT